MIKVITGRDKPAVTALVERLREEGAVRILLHPWGNEHAADGAVKLRKLAVEHKGTVVIVTFLDWVVNVLGEIINSGMLTADTVTVTVLENDSQREYPFDAEGYLVGWPIGYFLPSDIPSL